MENAQTLCRRRLWSRGSASLIRRHARPNTLSHPRFVELTRPAGLAPSIADRPPCGAAAPAADHHEDDEGGDGERSRSPPTASARRAPRLERVLALPSTWAGRKLWRHRRAAVTPTPSCQIGRRNTALAAHVWTRIGAAVLSVRLRRALVPHLAPLAARAIPGWPCPLAGAARRGRRRHHELAVAPLAEEAPRPPPTAEEGRRSGVGIARVDKRRRGEGRRRYCRV